MAKRQFKITTTTKTTRKLAATKTTTVGRRQQLPFKYSTICTMMIVGLLARLNSSGGIGMVNALSISLTNGNGNRFQQQQQQQQQDVQQQQQNDNLPQVQAGGAEDVPNYVMEKPTTKLVPNIDNDLLDQSYATLNETRIDGDIAKTQLSLGHPFQTLKLIKRAPGGFVGMRGKKDFYETDQDFLDDDENLAFPWQNLADNGNAGDSDGAIDDLIDWEEYAIQNGRRYKKAPTAFYGVRGKKFTPSNGVSPSGDTIRWNQFLQKLDEDRMRDMIMGNVMDRLLENADRNGDDDDNMDSAANDINKRAPTGFTGVRGKRPSFSFSDAEPSMDAGAKRATGHAFVGVRGKKDVSHQAFKRSPGRYFFDFWKKSAGGPGGKRQRFTDFGSKFVAVRGKKSPYYSEQLMRNDWTVNDNNLRRSSAAESTLLSSLLAAEAAYGVGGGRGLGNAAPAEALYGYNDKRAPAGFMGLRGKRSLTSDDLLSAIN